MKIGRWYFLRGKKRINFEIHFIIISRDVQGPTGRNMTGVFLIDTSKI